MLPDVPEQHPATSFHLILLGRKGTFFPFKDGNFAPGMVRVETKYDNLAILVACSMKVQGRVCRCYPGNRGSQVGDGDREAKGD